MNDTRVLFDRMLDDEPPLALTLAPVVEDGRRIKRRRRATLAAGALSVASVALLAVLPLGATTSLQPTRPASSASASPDGLTPGQRAIADAIVAASPAGWTFDFSPERWDGDILDTTVDDGNGASWFRVYTDTRLIGRCADEPVHGEICVEKTDSEGRLAAMWVRDSDVDGDLRKVSGVYISANRVGIIVTTANYLLDPVDPKGGIVTRAAPPYTEDQIHLLAEAIDEAYAPYR